MRFLRVFGVLVLIALAAVGVAASLGKLPAITNHFSNIPPLPVLQLQIPPLKISTPGPLRSDTEKPAQVLTVAGTLVETNRQRTQAGVPALTAKAKLAAAAQAKLADMFSKQYFEHIGPDGKGPAYWVEQAGYAYVAIGENLALGNFEGDAALVNAWMASPGHRANMLNKNFREIGIAVGQGTFEGETTWLAVQTFGTPTSVCPSPSTTLRQQFEQTKNLSAQIEAELQKTKATLDQLIAEYEQAKQEGDKEKMRELEPQIKEHQETYNSFVAQYNTLNNELVDLANQINAQIDRYNSCLAQFGR